MGFFTSDINEHCLALGLRREKGALGTEYRGHVSGVEVAVGWIAMNRQQQSWCAAELPHPTDLGLAVYLSSGFLGSDPMIPTGDATFDGLFTTRAASGEEASALALLSSEVRGQLLALAVVGYPRLTDAAVVCDFPSATTTLQELEDRLSRCAEVATRVTALAEALPAPRMLLGNGLSEAFSRAARERGLSVRSNALSAEGELPTARVRVRWQTQPTAPRHALELDSTWRLGYELRARFLEPLGVGLSLRPASLLDRAKELVGLGDLHLGDAAFDRDWTLSARDPEGAKALLHESARATLQLLTEAGLTLTLDDEGLEGHSALPVSPESAPRVLRLVEDLRDTLRPRRAVGPYRGA